MSDNDNWVLIRELAQLILSSKCIVAFTGAGISTESGIPDFRGKDGLWTKMDPDDFSIDRYTSNPDIRKRQWQAMAQGGMAAGAEPNAAHYALVELEKMGRLDCIVTQNVDNLHQMAGSSPDRVFELHGNMAYVRCLQCNGRWTADEILVRLLDEEVPACKKCGGILKPDCVFFGESLPGHVYEESLKRAIHCDLCIVIGSTLVVYPAAQVPVYAKTGGAKLAIINMGATPMDIHADVLIDGKAGEVMSQVMDIVRQHDGK